jgi:hypothetical protein
MVDAVLAAFVILEQTLHKRGHVMPDVKRTADLPRTHRRGASLINTLRRLPARDPWLNIDDIGGLVHIEQRRNIAFFQ